MKGSNLLNSPSDDELSALIEAIEENVDADEAVYVSAVAQSLHWSVERAETFLAGYDEGGERWRIWGLFAGKG